MIGAAATLAGILRMTVSLSVILIEATGDITLGLPIMFSILVAKLVGDIFNDGLLEMHMELSGLPFLNWRLTISTIILFRFFLITKTKPIFKSSTWHRKTKRAACNDTSSSSH